MLTIRGLGALWGQRHVAQARSRSTPSGDAGLACNDPNLMPESEHTKLGTKLHIHIGMLPTII